MIKELFIACAGAGKTRKIVQEAIELTNKGQKVLIITYTQSNQKELSSRFVELGGIRRELFVVKGWYSFILEDIIRPYQRCIFSDRVPGINLNNHNPHKRGNRYIRGRAEMENGKYNQKHFFDSKGRAHTEFISKLACYIIRESKADIAGRLSLIFQRVYFDEVQDFAGWDFDLLKKLTKSKELEFCAVGDFRQTIYHTSSNPKKPAISSDKLAAFKKMKFEVKDMNECWRSLASICEFADSIYPGEGYAPTISKAELPSDIDHQGIFYVSLKDVDDYVNRYKPMILRYSANSGKYLGQYDNLMTFGDSKGQTTNHVLIHPTQKILKFLKGEEKPFGDSATDASKNRLYVAVTRARYSVAFIVDDAFFDEQLWIPQKYSLEQKRLDTLTALSELDQEIGMGY